MRVVGVTGTIGSGKSAVLGLLAARGARTVDADALVHRLYEGRRRSTAPPLRALRPGRPLRRAGRPRRAAAGPLRPEALASLEAIVHPRRAGARDALRPARQGRPSSPWKRSSW